MGARASARWCVALRRIKSVSTWLHDRSCACAVVLKVCSPPQHVFQQQRCEKLHVWAIQLHRISKKRKQGWDPVAGSLLSVWGRARHSHRTHSDLEDFKPSSLLSLSRFVVSRQDSRAADVSWVDVRLSKFSVLWQGSSHLCPIGLLTFAISGTFSAAEFSFNTFLLACSAPALSGLLSLWESKETFPLDVHWAELDSHPYLHRKCKLRRNSGCNKLSGPVSRSLFSALLAF